MKDINHMVEIKNLPVTASGTQWIADFAGCGCDAEMLRTATALERHCIDIVRSASLQIMGTVFHQFQPVGATGLVLLAESHLAIHTWPELGSVAIDLYVCNVTEDNTDKAAAVFQRLIDLFAPQTYAHQIIRRGSLALSPTCR